MVQIALENGETSCLLLLIPYISGQPARELRTIEKILDKQPAIPQSFSRAMRAALAALPPAQGLRGFLHGLRLSYRTGLLVKPSMHQGKGHVHASQELRLSLYCRVLLG